MSAQESKERLLQLLDYVQHIVRLPERARFSVKDSGSFVYLQESLHKQIGVQFNVRGPHGRAWLKLVRLQRIDPPEVPAELKPWVTMIRNPFKEPKVASERIEIVTAAEGKRLVDQGLVDPQEIKKIRKLSPKKEKQVQVKRRLQKDGSLSEAIGKYLAGPWRRWAEMEKPRRASMKIYNDFFKLHQSIQAGAVEAPVEVIWGIGVAVWKTSAGTIKHPLIEVLVEIDIDPETNDILVRRRNVDPALFIKQFFNLDSPGLVKLQEESRKYFEEFRKGHDPRDFSPFAKETYEPLLRLATTLLSSSAQYYPDVADDPKSVELPTATEVLQITDTWAIYARPRSDNLFYEDIERLKKIVEDSDFESLPTAARKFVADPSDAPTYKPRQVSLLGGLGGREPAPEVDSGSQQADEFELFFPKEYNEAQVKIVHELEKSDGVVVQGPPGTGKTHTIANIICHYLATGRRVLVTSQGEPALKVLREFIPEEIRRLTISLLTKDREGLQQLETAVTLLANEVTRIVPEQIEKQIIESERKLRKLGAQIQENERAIREIAARQLTPSQHELFGKNPISPSELAKHLADDRSRHEWLPDELGLDPKFDPQFNAEHVAAARQARCRLGEDLQYISSKLPTIKNLPDNSKLQEIHEQIINADQNDPHAQDPDFPKLSVLAENALERAADLADKLRVLIEVQDLTEPHFWLAQLLQTWLELGCNSPATKPFDELIPDLQDLADRLAIFETRPVTIPALGEHAEAVLMAVARAAKGRRPFGALMIGGSQARQLFTEITVDGKAPVNAEAWQHVEDYLQLCDDAHVVAQEWNAIAQQFSLPLVDETSVSTASSLAKHCNLITKAWQVAESNDLRREIPELFPHGIDVEEVYRNRDAALAAIEAAEVNLTRHERASAQQLVDRLHGALGGCEGPVVKEAALFLRGKVGNQLVRTSEISAKWDALLADLKRVHSYVRDFEMVRKLADLVERSGASRWALALRTQPVTGDDDPWTPEWALESWNWRRLATYLHSIDGREPIRELSRQYLALEAERKSTLTEVVRLRTFLGLYVNMTDLAKSALVRFTAAIRHIGSGDGSRSRRHKRDAQDAMNDCYGAVPCWIMPIWRVSETLPPEIGSFDLVIVDEASQSDILAMPTLMRGRKLLIVGDDKQVSPVAPFVEERKLIQLRNQHLNNQIFVDLMIPGSSLYDLANAVFSGRRIMLDEHFRCVEPIIRFSFHFYPEKIIPVRIPKASERLEPPLVDVFVPGAKRDKKKINHREAEAVVDEIERLVNDPAFRRRSIGVVSLIGAQQGQYIQKLLLRRIGQEKYLRHQIDCGDSATFQGRERDIMFVSMVQSKGRIAAQTAVIYEQRFNVAMSRARDRMYLFRSIEPADLNPNDLKAKVIEHFLMKPEGSREPVEDLAELCETDLERSVYQHLLGLGYRVTPRVSVGEHSIDLVVEGTDDRRLAIELDGDRDQTADEWLEHWSRQKVLERVGWRFWRCWASSYVLDSKACMRDLLDLLAEMEIEPIGPGVVSSTHSEQRVIQEPTPDEAAEESFKEAEEEEEELAMLEGSGIEDETVVAVGDRVLVSYSDDPSRYRTLVISESEHDPENGIFISSDPVGQALLGAAAGEEIETRLDDDTQRVLTIYEIEKSRTEASLSKA